MLLFVFILKCIESHTILDPQNTHEKIFWIQKNTHDKNFGPTKARCVTRPMRFTMAETHGKSHTHLRETASACLFKFFSDLLNFFWRSSDLSQRYTFSIFNTPDQLIIAICFREHIFSENWSLLFSWFFKITCLLWAKEKRTILFFFLFFRFYSIPYPQVQSGEQSITMFLMLSI